MKQTYHLSSYSQERIESWGRSWADSSDPSEAHSAASLWQRQRARNRPIRANEVLAFDDLNHDGGHVIAGAHIECQLAKRLGQVLHVRGFAHGFGNAFIGHHAA